jgi:hypothetical protein
MLGLTKRQLICFSIAAVIGVPTYLLCRGAIGNSAAVMLMIVLMLPLFLLAMYEKDGQPAEKLLRNYLRARLWPVKRVYRTSNFYKQLEEEGKKLASNQTAAKAGTAPEKQRPAGKAKQG